MIVASVATAPWMSAILPSVTMEDLTAGVVFEICRRHTEWLELSIRHAAFLVFGTLVHSMLARIYMGYQVSWPQTC